MVKLLVGLLKGAVIGGGVGYGAYALWQSTDFSNAWLTYGLIGALVGLFVGRPLWSLIKDKNATSWIAILKGAFGFGVGCGLYALIAKAINPSAFMIGGYDAFSWPPILGGAIGAVYGAFVELDDAIGDDAKGKGKDKDKSAPVKQIAAKK